jgi:uncharacterized alkaline shock family protein YloU
MSETTRASSLGTETAASPTPATAPTANASTPSTAVSPAGSDGPEGHGRTVIADTVVLKIAGIAAREVSGVADLGRGAARAVGAIRDRISGVASDPTLGVKVEVGETQAAVDLDLVAEYGVAIGDLAEAVRTNVISAVERMTGLQVTEVNITVHDVVIDGDTEDEESERVR